MIHINLMGNLTHLIHSVPSDRSLEILTNSMWSTMIVTGIFFTSFLFVYLGIKVTKSIDIESSDAGPIEIAFLFSFSGLRYMVNHIRHHLFETPLTPRRRFSSLSVSWLPQFLKRTSFSFRTQDIFTEEPGSAVIEKGRRNSSFQTDLNTARKPSTSTKSKRLSVPNLQNNRHVSPTVNSPTDNVIEKPIAPVKLSRRNTLPNIAPSTNTSQISSGLDTKYETDDPVYHGSKSYSESIILAAIPEEEPIETTVDVRSSYAGNSCMPILEEEEISIDEDNCCESEFGEIVSDFSNSAASGNEEDTNEFISQSITIEPKSIHINAETESSILSQLSPETASPKTSSSSFRSSYLNYLPESIFGYSTGITKNNTNYQSVETTEAPPGFTKRSASHDYSSSPSANHFTDTSNEFNYHQPLYARRRTETSQVLSEAAKPFIPLNFVSVFKSKPEEVDMSPNRSNASSPCLIELQNTDDLFAPINWSFSNPDQTEELRKSWDSVGVIENRSGASMSRFAESETRKRKSISSFSSIFEG